MRKTRRVLLSANGSSGDIFPFLSLGAELRQRGYDVTLGSHSEWQAAAEEAGIGFVNIGPDFEFVGGYEAGLRQLGNHPDFKLDWLRDALLFELEDQTRRALDVIESCDLVVAHPLAFGARIASRVLGKPWVSTVLEPSGFFSEHDPQVPFAGGGDALGFLGGLGAGLQRTQIRKALDPLNRRILEVSTRFGNGLWAGEPLFEGQFSPTLNLGLMSRLIAEPQPDWPRQTLLTGFCHWDRGVLPLDEETMDWIEAGEAPVVLAMGDVAGKRKDAIEAMAAEAARRQGLRLLIVDSNAAASGGLKSHTLRVTHWASLKVILPRCRMLIHGGSIGMCGVALASGVPQLILPQTPLEEDHARRLVEEECAVSAPRRKMSSDKLEDSIREVASDEELKGYARLLQMHTRYESGPVVAVDALECVMFGAETEARFPTVHHGYSKAKMRQLWVEPFQSDAA